jgi:hypothetical protein
MRQGLDEGCCLDEVVLFRAFNAGGVDEATYELEQFPHVGIIDWLEEWRQQGEILREVGFARLL